MKLLISPIVFILTLLIKIGDLVLLVIRFFLRIIRLTSKKLRTNFKRIKIATQQEKQAISGRYTFRKNQALQTKHNIEFSLPKIEVKLPEIPKVKLKLPTFKRFSFKLGLPKAKPKSKKVKKIKTTVVYKRPHLIRLRIKYFLFGGFFSLIFIFLPLLFLIFLQNLPNPKELSLREISQTTKIYDRNGALLYQIFANENRTLVPLSSIPKDLINATIAIEDKDFYKNHGFDINAIARAAIADASGKPIQGGSTITQQLIKSTLLTPEISIERKIKEIILAIWTEKTYTKDEILQMYFNQVPYGGTAWGVEAASEVYFGKNVKDLDLAQSAFLAGMPQAPTTYSPYGESPNLWQQRQKDVLQKMQQQGYITYDQMLNALSENLVFLPPQTPIYAPHFVMYVKDLLIKKYGLPLVEKGGLTVKTSLDLKLQDQTQDIVKTEVDNDAYLNLTNGAALITNPKNGDILAMVGSRDYNDPNGGNVNLTTALRQPGSSIKVVTYATALSNGFTAATILDDSPVTFPGNPPYSPVNYDGAYHGRMPLRIAFANSFNIPAVKTLQKIGIPNMIDTGKKMGITTWGDPNQYGLAITLGAAEVKMVDMANAYGVVANSGNKVDLDPILKITDYQGNLIYEKDGPEERPVINPGVAFIISNILADNKARSLEFGTNSPLNIPNHIVSVKTGTSDNKRDNWTIGFTPLRLVAVWVGNNDNSPMSQTLASGITGAAPIWNKIMSGLLGNVSDAPLQVPSDVIQKSCLGRMEYFIKGTENLVNCKILPTPSPSPATN
ncbi:MAG: PBP1A family penicillin-binding protein [Patescibacteria group bacterium]|nr:PBP1A family penicillin-binding protein [Patescibacteria group bacterium]